MAEDDGPEGGGIQTLISRKIGPLPMWSWLLVAGGIGLVIYRLKGGKSTTTSGTSGMGGQFFHIIAVRHGHQRQSIHQ